MQLGLESWGNHGKLGIGEYCSEAVAAWGAVGDAAGA